ncbi:MAG TPA: SDR family NAD(P)-dependent oxidoreductase [Candidatus Saccharimonadales bacterium]|nr:SDR family NAD(P)-dependent oxidoreductase [Candidatus Saccharimonadales bacterium]
MSEKNRAVIITGGGSGIGKAIATTFAKNGDHVYIMGRKKEQLQEVVGSLSGYDVRSIVGDVTKPEEVQHVIDTVVKAHKTIDVLVNCAGASSRIAAGMDLATALKAWQANIDVNLNGTFLMIHAATPHMTRPGGRIINISSVAALSGSGQPGGEGYAASKAGLHGLTRTLVKILAPEGITINCVAPGFIKNTDFFSADTPMDERIKRASAVNPSDRVGNPDEVASAVFYLASDKASYINGDIINVNGGLQFGR